MFARSNTASALTRKLRRQLRGIPVTVRSYDYTQCAEITGELEGVMSARELLISSPEFQVSEIATYKHLPPTVYAHFV